MRRLGAARQGRTGAPTLTPGQLRRRGGELMLLAGVVGATFVLRV